MYIRPYWIQRIENAWKKVSIVWLSGVRRVGKTTLAKSLPRTRYLNCDSPQVQELLQDPEAFYKTVSEPCIIFDEVHQLTNPSQTLKIGSDEFPQFKILATGSSTLAATQKFRDSLTGRKRKVHLLPVLVNELAIFGIKDIQRRLLHGGLPPALLATSWESDFYSEWLDSYYARDVQELFRVEKRSNFLRLVEVVLRNNGGLVDVNTLTDLSSLSRPTVMNYLEALEVTHLVYILRPYFGGKKQELVKRPKIYGFDTGFVCYVRGWDRLRTEDCGLLWENLVLEHLLSRYEQEKIYFWRDLDEHEIDFVIPRARDACDVIECKWNVHHFDSNNLEIFRKYYPEGKNYVVGPHVLTPYIRQIKDLEIHFSNLENLVV